MRFLKLTKASDDTDIFINVDQIAAVSTYALIGAEVTSGVHLAGVGPMLRVNQSPEKIMEMIKEACPHGR